MVNDIVSIGLSIDGGYYSKINEALRREVKMEIRIERLIEYIRSKVSQMTGVNIADCQVTEGHYFRGRFRARDENRKQILMRERAFEDTLIENDIIFHYKHLREINNEDGTTTLIEKGIDVWFALETYELAQFRDFDFVVLIAGDADHEMLAKKLKALKVNVILLTWNLGKTASTSPKLKEEVCHHIELKEECLADAQLLQWLCKSVK